MILRPLSAVYGAASALRNKLFDWHIRPIYQSKFPVISVGNLTAGGNGKTPLCLYISDELKRHGQSPVILSRGYRGKLEGPHLVGQSDPVSDVGDEPLLMSKFHPVVVAKDRARGAEFIAGQGLGNVIVLDDGFQHRRLSRELDIVCINVGSNRAVDEFIFGRILPEGLFREPRDAGMTRAHAFVLSERRVLNSLPALDPRLLKLLPPQKQVFRTWLENNGVVSLKDNSPLGPQKVVAFSGLASPETFFATLQSLGFELAGKKAFADHHNFSSSDLSALRAAGLPLICSEKDSERLSGEARDGVYALKVSLKIDRPEEFLELLLKATVRP